MSEIKTNYVPSPIVTGDVQLPVYLQELIEFLAQNAHENWARQRVCDGWKYGEARDDFSKYHPCLVSYIELPEIEKEYDRIAARETIKVILKLGFEIIPQTVVS